MNTRMFCFQCEQTAFGLGCTEGGVCGKRPNVACAQDRLTGALITLARLVRELKPEPSPARNRLVADALFTTITNVCFDTDTVEALSQRVRAESEHLCHTVPDDFQMNRIWDAQEDIRSLKALILFGLRGMAAYAAHADTLGYTDSKVSAWFYTGLSALETIETKEDLLPLVLETGAVNLRCMELLDRANTELFGTPVPTAVSLAIEPGPFIVVTGHDLLDLKLLLEQTDGTGISVYTHGEMLPAHAYPELKKHPQLKGHFGTAWQNQQKEFDGIPAPILWTTNCLMVPRVSYKDRVFTTGVVAFPDTIKIGANKNFTPVIEAAKKWGGYTTRRQGTGVNGGTVVTTGFGHGAVLSVADKVVTAVKSGALRHIFLVGGCDGARSGRNYYTEFVKRTPPDTMVLTLACGKFRFNDLDLGTVGGLPRLLDMGQCNDAYSAIKVACALADAFSCTVNELPLSLILSWYEQKAVCILLTLLHLGIRNIRLGPTMPAFISPAVGRILTDMFDLKAITTPSADLAAILNGNGAS